MSRNTNGTEVSCSLASLGITSINLNAKEVNIALPDGSSIDGETTFATSGSTYTAATVTLVTHAGGHVVTPTATANADDSVTIASFVYNADGSFDYERLLDTSPNGLSKVLTMLDAGGPADTIQTDNTVTNGDGSTTETVTNYQGGAVTAAGGFITGGEKLDATATQADLRLIQTPASSVTHRDLTRTVIRRLARR